MSARRLIVNADDFNLTEGISRAVFFAHDHGIVNSTSVMINFPMSKFQLRGLGERLGLGVGLHLNVTSGQARFKKPGVYLSGQFDQRNLKAEFNAQIQYFYSLLRKLPDHLNTHHHIHASPKVFSVLAELARKYKIPIRRVSCHCRAQCSLPKFATKLGEIRPDESRRPFGGQSTQIASMKNTASRNDNLKVITTDYFFGNLSPQKYWTEKSLLTILENLPEGTSEIMCHPGFVDSELRSKSSFLKGRECERRLFSKNCLRRFLENQGIRLIKFQDLPLASVL